MTKTQRTDLAAIERRVRALPISSSQRVEAMAAVRHAFLIVEVLAWLGHKVAQIGAFFAPKRALRARYFQG